MRLPTLKTALAVIVALCFVGASVDSIVFNRPLPAELVTPLMVIILTAYMIRENGNGKKDE